MEGPRLEALHGINQALRAQMDPEHYFSKHVHSFGYLKEPGTLNPKP